MMMRSGTGDRETRPANMQTCRQTCKPGKTVKQCEPQAICWSRGLSPFASFDIPSLASRVQIEMFDCSCGCSHRTLNGGGRAAFDEAFMICFYSTHTEVH